MWSAGLIIVYCLFIVAASLLGGWLPSVIYLTHVRMQVMMSLVSGLMLGVALLHMLPHAAAFLPSISWVAGLMLIGLLAMFFLLRLFDVHQHGTTQEEAHVHSHRNSDHHKHHHLSWIGLLFGLAIHTLLDGVALGASVVAEAEQEPVLALFGLGTFLAVLLHKPLDALSITSLMNAGGWSSKSQAAVNGGFALMCPLGALLFWLGTTVLTGHANVLIGCALAFSAGFFLCIALSDLLPEVRFHRHDRAMLSVALLLGVVLAVGIELLPGHSHAPHDHPSGAHSDSHVSSDKGGLH